MSALKRLFNSKVNQSSPVRDDYVRKVNYDENGVEFITYEKFDYPTFQRSLGSVADWNLDALLKAGIDPAFPIHTGVPTRLEGLNSIDDFLAVADQIAADENGENESNE